MKRALLKAEPTTPILRSLLLGITKNIFVVSVLFIIVIILLICIFAINQCEKLARNVNYFQPVQAQRNIEMNNVENLSYQQADRII